MKRIDTPLPALLITMGDRHPAILLDMSETGARLRAKDAPAKGTEVFLRVGSLDVYARVVWTRKEHCGIRFEQPVRPYDIHQISIEAGKGGRAGMTAAQKGGADDWGTGVAR